MRFLSPNGKLLILSQKCLILKNVTYVSASKFNQTMSALQNQTVPKEAPAILVIVLLLIYKDLGSTPHSMYVVFEKYLARSYEHQKCFCFLSTDTYMPAWVFQSFYSFTFIVIFFLSVSEWCAGRHRGNADFIHPSSNKFTIPLTWLHSLCFCLIPKLLLLSSLLSLLISGLLKVSVPRDSLHTSQICWSLHIRRGYLIF